MQWLRSVLRSLADLGGGGAQRPQNSADARSDKKLGIGRKKAQDFKRLSFIVICCER
jgi:hypothetical protein